MILNCPSCSAKYNIADGAIPAHGRNVRCAACGHYWFQKPETAIDAQSNAPIIANDVAPIRSEKKSGFNLPFIGAKKSSPAPHEKIRKQAHNKIMASQAIGIAVGWGLAMGIVAIGAIIAIDNRNDIVKEWPKSATAFAFFGVPANLYGLEINAIMVRAGADTIGPRVIVSGVVQSIVNEGKPVPYLRVTLVDEKGIKKDSWMVDPGTIFLESKKFHAFASLRRNPPSGNLRAIVTFAEPPSKRTSPTHAPAIANSHGTEAINETSLAGGAPDTQSHGEISHDAHTTPETSLEAAAPTTVHGR